MPIIFFSYHMYLQCIVGYIERLAYSNNNKTVQMRPLRRSALQFCNTEIRLAIFLKSRRKECSFSDTRDNPPPPSDPPCCRLWWRQPVRGVWVVVWIQTWILRLLLSSIMAQTSVWQQSTSQWNTFSSCSHNNVIHPAQTDCSSLL